MGRPKLQERKERVQVMLSVETLRLLKIGMARSPDRYVSRGKMIEWCVRQAMGDKGLKGVREKKRECARKLSYWQSIEKDILALQEGEEIKEDDEND